MDYQLGPGPLQADQNTIDEKIKSDIGIVENGDIATHAIAKGYYVIWKGDLYIAKTDISSGTTLSASSNGNLTAKPSGLGAEVAALNSNFQDKVHFTFVDIGSAQMSATNNPLAIADNAVQTGAFEIIYVKVSSNTGFEDSTPLPYTVYEIRHTNDTITVNAINYLSGQVRINCRTRNSGWVGWRTITVS